MHAAVDCDAFPIGNRKRGALTRQLNQFIFQFSSTGQIRPHLSFLLGDRCAANAHLVMGPFWIRHEVRFLSTITQNEVGRDA